MKDIAKIFAYLAGTILLGALLAPPLYWAAGWLVSHGIFPVLAEFPFQKYFNRASLIAALALLWPTVRAVNVQSWRELGLERDPHWKRHLATGLLIAAAAVAAMALMFIHLGIYKWRSTIPWGKIPVIALSASVVAVLEEALFRGAIFGIFRRSLRPYAALFWVTALFAIVHFLKPDEDVIVKDVGWLSGFALVPHTFHQFAEPASLLAGFSTLFALGWLLGDATLRTRSLWMSIGLHAGVVFIKMSFSVLARRVELHLPWTGREFQNGLAPVAVLLLAWVVMRLCTDGNSPPRRQDAKGLE